MLLRASLDSPDSPGPTVVPWAPRGLAVAVPGAAASGPCRSSLGAAAVVLPETWL